MNITAHEEKDIQVFVLEGRIDTQGSVDLEKSLHLAVEAGNHKMILDMATVTYISSAALRILADVLTKNRKANGDLKLVGLNPKITRIFRIIGFDKYFSVFETVADAIAAY